MVEEGVYNEFPWHDGAFVLRLARMQEKELISLVATVETTIRMIKDGRLESTVVEKTVEKILKTLLLHAQAELGKKYVQKQVSS